jgi:hypothetical protein
MNRRPRRHDRHVTAVALTFLSLPFLILAIMVILKGVLS